MGSDGRGWQSEVLLGAGGASSPCPALGRGGRKRSCVQVPCARGAGYGGNISGGVGLQHAGDWPLLRRTALPQAGRPPRGCHRCRDPLCGGDHTRRPCQPRLGGEGAWGDLGAAEWQGKSVQQGGRKGNQEKKLSITFFGMSRFSLNPGEIERVLSQLVSFQPSHTVCR